MDSVAWLEWYMGIETAFIKVYIFLTVLLLETYTAKKHSKDYCIGGKLLECNR